MARGVDAGAHLDPGAVAALCRAARRRPERARGRPRIPARHLSWAAACVLARRACIRSRRPQRGRRLPALAGLHRCHLLGGIPARPLDRRRPTCRARGPAHGRHRRLHRADAGFRAGDPHHAAVGDHPAALLARGRRGAARLLAGAGGRGRPAAAHDLCRPHPGRSAGAVHAREPAGAGLAQILRSPDRGRGRAGGHVPAPHLARRFRRRDRSGAGAHARARGGDRQFLRLDAPARPPPCGACRAPRAGRAGGGLAVAGARARARDRAARDRAFCTAIHLFLRDRAGLRGHAGGRADRRLGPGRRHRAAGDPVGARGRGRRGRRHQLQPAAHRHRRLVRPPGRPADHGRARARRAALAQHRSQGDAARRHHGALLRRKLRAPYRRAAADRGRRSAHRRAGGARRAEPAQRLSRRDARAFALGLARRGQEQGCGGGVADHGHRRHAAARDQGAFPGSRARSPARLRAHRARPAAAPAHRLGRDPPARPAGRARAPRDERAEALSHSLSVVIAGLVPAISLRDARCHPKRDARVKPAHDDGESNARGRSMIPFAFAHLAVEQPVHKAVIGEDDRQQEDGAEQEEDLARGRGGGLPDRQARRHEIGEGRDHQAEIAQ